MIRPNDGGEDTAKMITYSQMARRLESESVMSKEQLAEFTRKLSMLSDSGVEGIYQSAYQECRYNGRELPQPAAVQRLVAAWRVLRQVQACGTAVALRCDKQYTRFMPAMTKAVAAQILFVATGFGQTTIQDLGSLVGKHVVVQRTGLCQPGTFNAVLTYAGKTATVLAVTPKKMPQIPPSAMSRIPQGQMRELLEGKGAIFLLKFEDGTELDSCAAITPSTMSDFVALVPGQTLESAPKPTVPNPSPTQPQECPVSITNLTSGNSFKASMLVSMESQGNSPSIGKSFLTVKYQNNSNKEVTGIRFRVSYFNSVQEVQHVSDVITPTGAKLKPKKSFSVVQPDWVYVGTEKMKLSGWVDKVVFVDGTSWTDNGSEGCAAASH